jgi:hypothetical protein
LTLPSFAGSAGASRLAMKSAACADLGEAFRVEIGALARPKANAPPFRRRLQLGKDAPHLSHAKLSG